MMKDHSIRIGDLGVAKILNDEDDGYVTGKVGTPYYLSPEQMDEQPYNEKADIWALGIILYELCALRHPFYSSNSIDLRYKILN